MRNISSHSSLFRTANSIALHHDENHRDIRRARCSSTSSCCHDKFAVSPGSWWAAGQGALGRAPMAQDARVVSSPDCRYQCHVVCAHMDMGHACGAPGHPQQNKIRGQEAGRPSKGPPGSRHRRDPGRQATWSACAAQKGAKPKCARTAETRGHFPHERPSMPSMPSMPVCRVGVHV